MKPFMRPVDGPQLAPVGWVAEPAGIWEGRRVEIVYDPRRHELVRATFDMGARARTLLASSGFRCVAAAGDRELWVRDRQTRSRVAVDRLSRGEWSMHSSTLGR